MKMLNDMQKLEIIINLLIGMSYFLSKQNLSECNDLESANKSRKLFGDLYEPEAWQAECPLPCEQKFYKLRTVDFHRNIMVLANLTSSTFYLSLRFDKFVVETEEEVYYYDLVDILTQVGGNLGLFLGFSCLSFFLSIADCFNQLPTLYKWLVKSKTRNFR